MTVLDELCAETSHFAETGARETVRPSGRGRQTNDGGRCSLLRATFITPMAAVAGAVAEEILGAMTAAAKLSRAYVNNGGDIALHFRPVSISSWAWSSARIGRRCSAQPTLDSAQPVRGIATSGWRGRSFSLGIADAVTVLADRAAMADAAATIIANAVDLPGHPGSDSGPRTRTCSRQRPWRTARDSELSVSFPRMRQPLRSMPGPRSRARFCPRDSFGRRRCIYVE